MVLVKLHLQPYNKRWKCPPRSATHALTLFPMLQVVLRKISVITFQIVLDVLFGFIASM